MQLHRNQRDTPAPLSDSPTRRTVWDRPGAAEGKLRGTCARSARGALLSGSVFPTSASSSVGQRWGSVSRLVWYRKEKMGKRVSVRGQAERTEGSV